MSHTGAVDAAGRPPETRPIAVTIATEADRPAWDEYVNCRVTASADSPAGRFEAFGSHAWAWRDVFARSFGHRSVYLVARRSSEAALVGVLPLTEIRSWLFGRSLTSQPFLNYGGVLAESPAVARTLVEAAARVARDRRCRHVELRHVSRQFEDLPSKAHKVTMVRRLEPGLWDKLDRKVRNQVRKAQKSDLSTVRGGTELLDDFYRVFARNMRDLGTPVYAREFFKQVLAAFPARAQVVVVRLGPTPVAAGVTYRTGGTIEVPWASSVRDFNALCPNHLLYWSILESALADGVRWLDFGRSTPHEGTYKFKEQWGAQPVPLHWEYAGLEGNAVPDQTPKNPKFRLAVSAWRQLPLWLANRVGPAVVRHVP